MADAAAELMDARSHLLQASAGRGHDADRPRTHFVGKTKTHAANQRGAAVWTHDEQALGGSRLLQRHFVFHRHVITEKENVLAHPERLTGHAGCITAGHGHQHPRGVGQDLGGHLQALRAIFLFER